MRPLAFWRSMGCPLCTRYPCTSYWDQGRNERSGPWAVSHENDRWKASPRLVIDMKNLSGLWGVFFQHASPDRQGFQTHVTILAVLFHPKYWTSYLFQYIRMFINTTTKYEFNETNTHIPHFLISGREQLVLKFLYLWKLQMQLS